MTINGFEYHSPEDKELRLPYKNHQGETSVRHFRPLRLWFGSTEWHPKPQWLIHAFDIEKGDLRDFALSGFLSIFPIP